MDIQSWLERSKKNINHLDAELIAMQNFAPKNADRSWLVTHGEQIIHEYQLYQADWMLNQRVSGVPMAYILGKKEFYGRKFSVKPGVLIPRPETETLIDMIKTLDLPKQSAFLDIGTGSGCIAITLALEYPQSYVLATDFSSEVLQIAGNNNLFLEGRVEMVKSNLLRDLEFSGKPEHFDVVVANLPYVSKEWDWVDQKNLMFEPDSALYANGNNGLSLYQRFLKELSYHRSKCDLRLDYLVLEADPCQRQELIEMARKAGFIHLRTEGFGLLFEDTWRYWWDYEANEFIHKPQEVIDHELITGEISYLAEEVNY